MRLLRQSVHATAGVLLHLHHQQPLHLRAPVPGGRLCLQCSDRHVDLRLLPVSLPHPHTAPPSSAHVPYASWTCPLLSLLTAITLKWLLVQVRCSCPSSQASAAVKPLACPCQNAACGSATWPLVACRSFPVDSEENPNSQAWPQQMRLKRLHVPAVQAHPAVRGDLHCGGRPEGHLHQLLPAHGAHLPLLKLS